MSPRYILPPLTDAAVSVLLRWRPGPAVACTEVVMHLACALTGVGVPAPGSERYRAFQIWEAARPWSALDAASVGGVRLIFRDESPHRPACILPADLMPGTQLASSRLWLPWSWWVVQRWTGLEGPPEEGRVGPGSRGHVALLAVSWPDEGTPRRPCLVVLDGSRDKHGAGHGPWLRRLRPDEGWEHGDRAEAVALSADEWPEAW